MGRKDYNTLSRHTDVTVYGASWYEKQNNTKIVFDQGNQRSLAEEIGKIWSVRIPDSECAEVSAWADERQPFWDLLAEAWELELSQGDSFKEVKLVDGSTRSDKIEALLKENIDKVGNSPAGDQIILEKLRKVIIQHRQ